jgi:hypothetical protein
MQFLIFALGFIFGMGLIFFKIDAPIKNECATYTVKTKAVTAYVLKPPYVAPEIIHEKCPVLKNPEIINQSETVVNETPEGQPRRRRHHRRHRRYW